MSSQPLVNGYTGGAAAVMPALTASPINLRLTRKERELLSVLQQNPGRCISRDTLLRTVWKYADGARTRTVDVHVQRLRRKLGRDAAAIKTIVRLGYCWFPEPDAISRPAPVW
ncbi:MAG: winged helix-turn-helix transcriptional regulator [Acidobacteria bacterium]|nr:winged helix-turn-helix transcriptional regulator [Acidobacteriota bacterium]